MTLHIGGLTPQTAMGDRAWHCMTDGRIGTPEPRGRTPLGVKRDAEDNLANLYTKRSVLSVARAIVNGELIVVCNSGYRKRGGVW